MLIKKDMPFEVSKGKKGAPFKSVNIWQKIKVLLWKTYILRKRHWVITLLEITLPIIVFYLVVHFKNLLPDDPKIIYDTSPNIYTDLVTNATYNIAYTPSNNFTDSIMNATSTRLAEFGCTVTLLPESSEDLVVDWLKQLYISETKNFSYTVSKGVGVVFLDAEDSSNLSYVLRTTTGNLETTDDTLTGAQTGYSYSYQTSGFIAVQTVIDQAYLTMYHNIQISNKTLVGEIPSVEYMVIDLVEMLLPTIISLGFTFVMPSLLREIVEEKTSGIKEMMKIMGLKMWINWMNWFVYSMIVYVPVTLVVTAFLTSDLGTGASVHANFFAVWIMFLLFTMAFMTLIFAMSTVFTNGTIAMITGEIAWYGATILLDSLIVQVPDKYGPFVNLLSCLCPSIALVWTVNTINDFQKNNTPWSMSDLFNDGSGGRRVSVGLAAIMLCVDIMLYSFITWYMDNVKPGPYGRAKPLTFVFKCFKKKVYEKTSTAGVRVQNNFETPPKNVMVGIRIENLRKTFDHDKVVAVDNVDLDIYEGNITALLGHNGAGKTTTMSILSGFYSPTRGKVIVRGKNIFDNMDDFRSSLGICPQHNLLFSFFTVLEHLIFFGMLKGLTMEQSSLEGKTLLRSLKVDGKRNELVSNLSGGMKRKLCLAIALMGNPQVLMLDEPTSGLDPESRRQVWDMLLQTRGQRTTIITTHFMEEADVLGDRIAIMDHGLVSCYGTSMFLKKLYGSGYHLNISKTEQSPVAPITYVVEQFLSTTTMKLASPTQLTYNINADESFKFAALFTALDTGKNELGLTGMGITCTTMEDVFLRVTEKPDLLDNGTKHIGNGTLGVKPEKISGFELIFLQFKALTFKRILIRKRRWFNTLLFMSIPVILMAASVLRMMSQNFESTQPNLLIGLISFSGIHVAVASHNTTYTSVLKKLIASGKATYESVPDDSDLNTYLGAKIKENLITYEKEMFAGFEEILGFFIAGFSRYFLHSPAVVLNLIANTLLQVAGVASNITVYNHPIVAKEKDDMCDLATAASVHIYYFPLYVVFVSLGLLILAMSFISFPLKERVNNAKQLQLMTGLSPLLYWFSIFVVDAMMYFISAALMICMVFIFQDSNIFTASGYMGTLMSIFVLFGTSGIGFAYFFSFFVKSSVKASVIFVIINLVMGTFGGVFIALLDGSYTGYGVWRFFLSFNPLFAATSALIHLMNVMYIDGTCLQCLDSNNYCSVQDPLQFLDGGYYAVHPNGINSFLIFLVADTFIYFGLVLIIEYGIAKKIAFLISTTVWIKKDFEQFEEQDNDILNEKERVIIPTNKVEGFVPVFRVNNLGKKYNRKMTAVNGVSFQVVQGECFGLLGVNGAGKSTTFKMLTGEVIPNKGDATILHSSLLKNKAGFLAQIGYCPQFDAINKLLTGEEMLHVYASLRGIPSANSDSEVSRWIQIMGLMEFGDRACGTYSGGNKRKLSTAMAFIGEPPVVFLDEPTSGVDPVSRRKLWDVVAKCQQAGQAIVLTSHSMEECEALCSRLTIMVAGQMKCIGTTQHLKHKFGQGYTIQIKLSSSQELQGDLKSLKLDMGSFFNNCSIKDEHLGLLHYHVPDSNIKLAELFSKMEQLKRTHGIIEDYVVSDTTLEQVFMSFARTANEETDTSKKT